MSVPKKEPFLLGIDVGTTATKLALFTYSGECCGLTSLPYEIKKPQLGWAEVDPEQWWKNIIDGLHVLSRKTAIPTCKISCIGLSTIFPCIIPFNERGEVLRNGILYCDSRSLPQTLYLEDAEYYHKIRKTSGNIVRTGPCSLPIFLWIKDNEPGIYKKTKYFGTGNTFLAFKLTGNFAMDWTNASETALFETGRRKIWSAELCALTGIAIEKLPPSIPSTHVVGKITSSAAKATGLAIGVPVAIGGGDVACSPLGAGIVGDSQLICTSGTTDVYTLCLSKPKFNDSLINITHIVPDRWLSFGVVLSAGASLHWFKEHLSSIQSNKNDGYRTIEQEAMQSKPGANGVFFLPHLQGEYAPILNRKVRGAFFGLSLTTTRADICRAVFEGVAFEGKKNVELMKEISAKPISQINIAGGCTKSNFWTQMKADIQELPLAIHAFEDTTVLGAAILGGIGAKIFRDYQDAIKKMKSLIRTKIVEPQKRMSQIYSKHYEMYIKLYPSLQSQFSSLFDIMRSMQKINST